MNRPDGADGSKKASSRGAWARTKADRTRSSGGTWQIRTRENDRSLACFLPIDDNEDAMIAIAMTDSTGLTVKGWESSLNMESVAGARLKIDYYSIATSH